MVAHTVIGGRAFDENTIDSQRWSGATVDATDYSVNVTRSVPVMPVPVLGERYGIDLNMVTADFKLNVILADDDCAASCKCTKRSISKH